MKDVMPGKVDELADVKMLVSGAKYVTPFNLQPEDVNIRHIARSLSHIYRFLGHSTISVAEHSIRVAWECSQENRIYGLLHDAGEAYFGDVPTPVKRHLFFSNGASFKQYEEKALGVILHKYGLSPELPEEVKKYDEAVFFKEMEILRDPNYIKPKPQQAEHVFLSLFHHWTGDKYREH